MSNKILYIFVGKKSGQIFMSEIGSIYSIYLHKPYSVNNQKTNYADYQRCNINFGAKQEPKSNISAKKIARIAFGLSMLAAGIILFKKWNPKPVKELAQHIDFVKADNVESAIKFAQENFGVKLRVNGQLKTANWINESLVNLSNKTKGKVLLPKEIKICKLPAKIQGKYNPFTRTVKLGENCFGNAFERDFEKVKDLGLLSERLVTLYHEIGHGIHLTTSNIINEVFGTSGYKKIISGCRDDLTQYLGGKYFTRCEGEAYAQIFGKKMAEGKLPDFVEKVWQKIGGKY